MKRQGNTIATYKDAFEVRMLNARVTVRKTKADDWILTFFRVSENDWTELQKSTFDVVVERFGLIYTKKYLRLSPTAMELILAGYCQFHKDNRENTQP